MQGTEAVGWLLIVLGTLSILLAFAIAVKQYILTTATANFAEAESLNPAKLLVDLILGILKAPPALAFLVVGCLLLIGGVRLLSGESLIPSFGGEASDSTSVGNPDTTGH